MRCPYCGAVDSDRVIDSRTAESGAVIRRRRECDACKRRFTTKERVESDVKLQVIKKDGTRVPYDRSRVLAGLQKACYKRSVSDEQLQALVDKIEEALFKRGEREVSSRVIGGIASHLLRELDKVAYVRFASVYREFEDIGDFVDEIQDVMEHAKTNSPGQQTLF
jgi:transcriptional repressor NrdR